MFETKEAETERCEQEYKKIYEQCEFKREYELKKCHQRMKSFIGCESDEDEACILLPEQLSDCERQVDENPWYIDDDTAGDIKPDAAVDLDEEDWDSTDWKDYASFLEYEKDPLSYVK